MIQTVIRQTKHYIITATIQSTLEYGAVLFGMMVPSNIYRLHVSQNQDMRLILGVPWCTSANMMRHELQMLPVEHRAKINRDKLYRKFRGNTKHTLHTTINRRQRNRWTTEIQEYHRLASRQLEEPTQLQRDDTAPWEQLPYECRIDWTREGTEILKQRSLEYIRSQPDDNTYYTDGLSDGTRVAAAVLHKEDEIIIRLNDSASVLDAEMTAIRVALENASETGDNTTIHIYYLTAVNIVSNRKLDLNTITRAIRDAASRLIQRPTIKWRLQTTQPTSGGAVTADSSCCANCVEPPRPQLWGPDLPFFGHASHAEPAGWLALLLTKAGDVETNPGPTTLNKKVWICDICHKQIHVRKQISIRCNRIEHWVHLRCAGIRQAQYTDTWTCHLHR